MTTAGARTTRRPGFSARELNVIAEALGIYADELLAQGLDGKAEEAAALADRIEREFGLLVAGAED